MGAWLACVLHLYYRKEETMSETSTQRAAEKQVRRSAQRRLTQHAVPLGELAKLATRPAQVRLRADELARLAHSMQVLQITSTSDALREGLRLLEREAYEEEAAAEIRAFYQNQPAPLPDGVVPIDEAEMVAADPEW